MIRLLYALLLGVGLLLPAAFIRPVLAQQQMLPLPRQVSDGPPGANLMASYIADDEQGKLWLPTANGLVRFDGQQLQVFHAPWQPQDDSYGSYSRPVFTPDGRVWVQQNTGSYRGILAYFDPRQARLVRVADTTRLVREFLKPYGFGCLYTDRQGQLWIALHLKGLLRVNPKTLIAEHILTDSIQVLDMAEDTTGGLWFTSRAGLHRLNLRTRQYTHQTNDANTVGGTPTGAVSVLPNGDVLVGLKNEIDVLNTRTGRFRRIRLPLPDTNQSLWTEGFELDRQGNAYFSVGRMVFRLTANGELQRIEFARPSEKIISICVSQQSHTSPPRLWVNTISRKLAEYDLTQLKPILPFNLLDVSVNGTRLAENEQQIDERLTRNTAGQATLTVQEGDFIQLRFAPHAELRSALFRHKLEGYDQQWTVYQDAMSQVTYRLPAGEYTFLFNRATTNGSWPKQIARLAIQVKPPFWRTGWFISILLVVVGLGLLGLYRIVARRQKLQRDLVHQENEAQNLRQLDELKDQFFANVTHELRTPLTLLLNANEQLSDQPLNERGRDHTAAINRNANQLLRLITQLLDMARVNNGKLDLTYSFGDPVAFVGRLGSAFDELARTKQIQLSLQAESAGESYLFDEQKMEAIFHNLLSNALKFTPAGGIVQVAARVAAANQFELTVTDTGPGISPNALPHIFERFYQADSSATRIHGGTGIGLAYVRELTELMGGTVQAVSSVGVGSTFTVTLPVASPGKSGSNSEPIARSQIPSAFENDYPISETPTVNDSSKASVLIVEDNDELRTYLANQLESDYQIITAVDGRAGLEQAFAVVPDLILSDVMMPNMDGFAMVGALKTDLRTSHIPVILLTARSSHDSMLQGLNVGADAYIGKPFKIEQLKLQIRNTIQTRHNWQAILSRPSAQTSLPSTNQVPDREKQFLARLAYLIERNLQNDFVDVNWLATQANMSRAQLHRKLTALTGQSTTHFIHRVRLEKANALLQMGTLNVAEVAYQVGYSSQSYFTKMFQSHFGYLPTTLKA